MKLAFAGTPEFAASALRALIAAGHDLVLVLTRPDQPSGRGMRMTSSPVSAVAEQRGIDVFKPASLRNPEAVSRISEASCEALIVAAYGLILPPSVLSLPALGCLNIHASLLPRWRGAAPIHRAIEAGDSTTGISIMRMDAGLDTGEVLLQREIDIRADETTGSLTSRLAELGAQTIVEALAALPRLSARAQDESLATYANKVSRAEAKIDWAQPAAEIERKLRALDPFPGCETLLHGQALKVWSAAVAEGDGPPGTVISLTSADFIIATGAGAIALRTVQRPGGRRLAAGDFLRAEQVRPGTVLGH